MARRYLFLCPDEPKASGGMAVIYDAVAILREAGMDAAVVHYSPQFRYPGAAVDVPVLYDTGVLQAWHKLYGWRSRPFAVAKMWRDEWRGGPNTKLELRPDDVIVVPELLLHFALDVFRDHEIFCFVQNPFAYLRSSEWAREKGLDPVGGVSWNFSMSDVVQDALEMVGAERIQPFSVAPNLAAFPYLAEKSAQVAYMPRKRPDEARMLRDALKRRGQLGGADLVEIHGMSPAQVQEIMGGALIFVSLLKNESLGFPAAEAMAAGCIVIGYTGLGAREFFNDDTGIVIEEGDTPGLIRAVEHVIAEYNTDPTRLDALRRHASEHIHARYSQARFRDTLTQAFRATEEARTGG